MNVFFNQMDRLLELALQSAPGDAVLLLVAQDLRTAKTSAMTSSALNVAFSHLEYGDIYQHPVVQTFEIEDDVMAVVLDLAEKSEQINDDDREVIGQLRKLLPGC